MQENYQNVMSSFTAGLINSVVFHPFDRALYLKVTDKQRRSLFTKAYFAKPLHGLSQSITQRIISSGSYFFLQDKAYQKLSPFFSDKLGFSPQITSLFVGLFSGSVQGIIVAPSSAVKYYTWNHREYGFIKSLYHMHNSAQGNRLFARGLVPTIYRDMIFCCAYEFSRNFIACLSKTTEQSQDEKPNVGIAANMFSAGIAAIVSSPLNYSRNYQFRASAEVKTPSLQTTMLRLYVTIHQLLPQ